MDETNLFIDEGSYLPGETRKERKRIRDPPGKGYMAYFRAADDERILVILNFTGNHKTVSLQEHVYGKILWSTHRIPDEFSYFQKMQIGPYEATICCVNE